jgi:hypothetical protein
MPRGNFWEATYDPHWAGPTAEATLVGLEGSSGLVKRRIVSPDGKPVSVQWKRRDKTPRHFQKCDFQLDVHDSLISDCTFSCCRFKGSTWVKVKFSNCLFQECDFTGLGLVHCYFVSDCKFLDNSASGEWLRIEETAISATAFVLGLRTNLRYLPAGVSAQYQQYRFVGTKQKIAKLLYSATRNEADLEYFHQAYEQLVRSTLDLGVEQHRFAGDDGEHRPPWKFFLHSLPGRVERFIVGASGWLTRWGRSVSRACLFLIAVIAVFAVFYATRGHHSASSPASQALVRSVFEAVNITLVAGHTAYYRAEASLADQFLWTLNLILGLYWYSLIIPVLSRRILR